MTRAAKGEGSVAKSGAGYRGYITVDGKREYTKVYPTKAMAAQAKRSLLEQRDNGTLTTGVKYTLGAWMLHWLAIADLKPTVRATYRFNIEHYIVPTLGAIKLGDLRAEHLEHLYALMLAGKLSRVHTVEVKVGRKVKTETVQFPLAPRTIGGVHANIRRALTVAWQRGHVSRNVALLVTPPSKPKADTTSFLQGEAELILFTSLTDRYAARWHLALLYGVRPAEALGLTWGDVDLPNAVIHVHSQLQRVRGVGLHWEPTAKTLAGDRLIPISPVVVELLRATRAQQMVDRIEHGDTYTEWEYNGQPVALVFNQANGRPVDSRRDGQNWKALLIRAGVDHARLYQSRHTSGTLMAGLGADATTIAAVLGHANASMTLDLYIHPLKKSVEDITSKMGQLSPGVRVDLTKD